MLKWTFIFGLAAAVANFFGFPGLAAGAVGIDKVPIVLFLVSCVVVLLTALLGSSASRRS